MFAIAPEALYKMFWTGPVLFSMDSSTLFYNQVLAFTKSLVYDYFCFSVQMAAELSAMASSNPKVQTDSQSQS